MADHQVVDYTSTHRTSRPLHILVSKLAHEEDHGRVT